MDCSKDLGQLWKPVIYERKRRHGRQEQSIMGIKMTFGLEVTEGFLRKRHRDGGMRRVRGLGVGDHTQAEQSVPC